jgi:hypothetical protein
MRAKMADTLLLRHEHGAVKAAAVILRKGLG